MDNTKFIVRHNLDTIAQGKAAAAAAAADDDDDDILKHRTWTV